MVTALAPRTREALLPRPASLLPLLPKHRPHAQGRPALGRSHRSFLVSARSSAAAFSEAGVWDYVIGLAAKAATSTISAKAIATSAVTSSLESTSTALSASLRDLCASVGPLVTSMARPSVGAGAAAAALAALIVVACAALTLVATLVL